MNLNDKIYVAGHRGLVGSAIMRLLLSQGFNNIITKTSAELDLREQKAVRDFFETEKPDYVFLAAAKVGGIHANNTYPADFIYDNLAIQNNIINSSFNVGVKKLLFLGSSCIYPKNAQQPIKEEYLLSGYLEPTNEAYAIAKIAGIKLCQSYYKQHNRKFISVMPTNLYGPGDNYNLQNSHVLPALIRKFHEATVNKKDEVVIWGSGLPRREFLHSDDMASACVFLMKTYDSPEIVNIGTGEDIAIKDLAELVKKVTNFSGKIVLDSSKPDGTLRKLMDVNKLSSLGWKAAISLEKGIELTYNDFVSKYEYYANAK